VRFFVAHDDGRYYFLQAQLAISTGPQYRTINPRMRHVLQLHDYDYAAYYVGRTMLLRKLMAPVFSGAEVTIVLGRRTASGERLSRSLG
jgi:hypothetical protein